MTSLQLDILNHYYGCANDYEFEGNDTRLQQASDLEVWELLTDETSDGNKYEIANRGRFFIEHILNLPLPDPTFIIPNNKGE